MSIYISGFYCGPSPSAGLGVARCLRDAWPNINIIGVDYDAGSTGLHHPVLNGISLKPSWDHLDRHLHKLEIEALLSKSDFWIPTLDLEVEWLAKHIENSPRLLSPTAEALASTQKPHMSAAKFLPFQAMPWLDASSCTPAKVYEYCRWHSWRVWLKGAHHEAIPIYSWRDYDAAKVRLEKKWGPGPLSIQTHVNGAEESLCFAAYQGQLIDAIWMQKRIKSPEGKTWAGRISDVPKHILDAVDLFCQETLWTGGIEIELIRDHDGELWLLEINPRFPAWIYGAALSGRNLPAALVSKVTGDIFDRPQNIHREFARVVSEVPVHKDFPLPLPILTDDLISVGKYGARLDRISKIQNIDAKEGVSAHPFTMSDLSLLASVGDTPKRILLKDHAEIRFRGIKDVTQTSSNIQLNVAYSVKTSPYKEYLSLAKKHGALAECISLAEVHSVMKAGFAPGQIILNGPGKWWPKHLEATDGLHAVFCDSLNEFSNLLKSGRSDRIWGVRIKLPGTNSRFGIDLEEPDEFARMIRLLRDFPKSKTLGLHFHMASVFIGVGRWFDAIKAVVAWGRAIEDLTGLRVEVLDFGGGYHPEDFGQIPFGEILSQIENLMPSVSQAFVEPGRALSQDTMALVSGILDIRRRQGSIVDIVVDASLAEVPLVKVYPHRMYLLRSNGDIFYLPAGSSRILGRICMEDDILSASVKLPDDLNTNDRIVIGDCGAYDRSMSYEFGHG